MSAQRQAYWLAISSFLIWGFFSVPLRFLQGYEAGAILWFRVLFAFFILIALIFQFKQAALSDLRHTFALLSFRRRIRFVGLTLLGGLLLISNWLIFIYVVNAVNIKTASFSYLICPVMTAILGFIILKETMTTWQWIAVGICVLSCVLLGIESVAELGYSLVIGLTYAFYLISQRKNQQLDKLLVLCLQLTLAMLVLVPLYDKFVTSTPTTPYFYAMVLLISVVFTVLPLYLNLLALKQLSSASLGILMYLNPTVNFILAVAFFGEPVSFIQAIGYGLIFVALVLFNWQTLFTKSATTPMPAKKVA
ncbi:MAG TPA: EamA family transporter [Microscillaceae bacterium]|jgi:chloramphenicol-sensitive protein RarD|nr:EamA family transporter [Microscillaceae bacterium]